MRNLIISVVLGNSYPHSCNFNFRHNLIDLEIVLLKRLMFSLSTAHLSLSTANSRAWTCSPFGLFSVKSFFTVLSKSLNPISYLLSNFVWKSKAPSKVKAFTWLVVHRDKNISKHKYISTWILLIYRTYR